MLNLFARQRIMELLKNHHAYRGDPHEAALYVAAIALGQKTEDTMGFLGTAVHVRVHPSRDRCAAVVLGWPRPQSSQARPLCWVYGGSDGTVVVEWV